MTKLATLLVASAALAVGACTQSDDAADTAATENATGGGMSSDARAMAPAPTVTETTVIRESDGRSTADATGDRVTIGPDGVSADIGDGDTRVRADVDEDPSVTVTDR